MKRKAKTSGVTVHGRAVEMVALADLKPYAKNAMMHPVDQIEALQAVIRDSVFRVMRHKARGIETAHPAIFPVALAREVIMAFSRLSDAVYEPFCGSGSVVLAAEMEKRRCFGLEIEPAYCEVIIRRWESFAKKTAMREDGATLESLAKAKKRKAA